jgi:predicted alpha/beta superfamily hydrolase
MLMVLWLFCAPAPVLGVPQQDREIPADVRVHTIKSVSKPRDILVWLPSGYEAEGDRRYPTLYLHDGASTFVIWRMDETAKRLLVDKAIGPLIIVMIPNGGDQDDRFNDYTPTRPRNAKAGGQADAYGRRSWRN